MVPVIFCKWKVSFNDQTNGEQRRPYNLPDGDITQISRIGLMCSRSKIVFKDFKYNIDNTMQLPIIIIMVLIVL